MEIIWIKQWLDFSDVSSARVLERDVPKMKNLTSTIKEGNCYLDCGCFILLCGSDVICLKCGSSIKRPEFPEENNMKLVDLTFSEQEYTDIHNLAGCNYSQRKLLCILMWIKKLFWDVWSQKESEVQSL
jgi:hypothetical protein